MSYKSKRTITSMLAGIVLIIVYVIFAVGKNANDPGTLASWAVAMLIFIGAGVVALIIIQILFHIGYSIGVAVKERNEDEETVERIISAATREDEMEKTIELRASHVGYRLAGLGFVAALAALALGASALFALHMIAGTCAAASIIEGIVSIYYFERGLKNG